MGRGTKESESEPVDGKKGRWRDCAGEVGEGKSSCERRDLRETFKQPDREFGHKNDLIEGQAGIAAFSGMIARKGWKVQKYEQIVKQLM